MKYTFLFLIMVSLGCDSPPKNENSGENKLPAQEVEVNAEPQVNPTVDKQYTEEKKQFTTMIAQLKKELKQEKEERRAEKEACAQQLKVLNEQIRGLEREKQEIGRKRAAEIDDIFQTHRMKISQLQKEIRLADAAGYKRGVDEMLSRINQGKIR